MLDEISGLNPKWVHGGDAEISKILEFEAYI